MTVVEAPWEAVMGAHRRGERGGRRSGRGGALVGRAAGGSASVRALCCLSFAVGEKEGGRKREEN
jgi:hypothetical protein